MSQNEVPQIRVQSRGRINGTLEFLAMAYEKKHLEGKRRSRVTRWVYSPLHKPEISNVVGRKVDGWTEVYVDELKEATSMLGLKSGEVVRMGDVILMWTTPENRAALRQELKDRAAAQVKAVQETHEENIRAVSVPGMRKEHEVRPRGSVVIEEREFQLDSRKLQEAAEARRLLEETGEPSEE